MIVLVVLLIAMAIALLRMRSLLAMAILTGAYSLILAVVFTLLDAVDVAFTEAAVGAGITLALMLTAISLTTDREAPRTGRTGQRLAALAVALGTGAVLIHATFDMPATGDFAAPVHGHVGNRYVAEGPEQTGVPNMVTAVLASYRGFDTLGEVTVIFTAGIGVIALLRRWRRDEA